MTFQEIRKAALALPDVEEETAWNFPAFRVRKKMFLCFREDLDSILVFTTFDQRDAMIEEDPETYYTTDHHRPYTCVLARIDKLHKKVLPDLLQMSWRHAAPKARAPRRRGKAAGS